LRPRARLHACPHLCLETFADAALRAACTAGNHLRFPMNARSDIGRSQRQCLAHRRQAASGLRTAWQKIPADSSCGSQAVTRESVRQVVLSMQSLRDLRGRVLSSARAYPSIWMGPSLSAGLRGPSRTAWATTCERRCAAPLAHMHTSYSPVLPTCHAHTPLYFRSPAPVLRVFDGIVPSLPGTCGLCSWGTRGVVVWVASSRTRERAAGPSVLCAAVPVPCPCATTRGCEL
jgi:hypothetical protein